MNDKNKYAGVMIGFLLLVLTFTFIAIPIKNTSVQEIESFGDILFQEDEYEIYVNHTIDFIHSEDGDWYFDGNETYLGGYIISTQYNVSLHTDFVTITEEKLENDAFFTFFITLSIYDENNQSYTVYDEPLIDETIEMTNLTVIESEGWYSIIGNHVSDVFEPKEFDGSAYQTSYIFSTQYDFLIITNNATVREFNSDYYLLPFEFLIRYSLDDTIPSWWFFVSLIIGVSSIILGYMKFSGKLEKIHRTKTKQLSRKQKKTKSQKFKY